MIAFVGTSHAPKTLAAAARIRGLTLTDDLAAADCIFVSEDTPTCDGGKRDTTRIRELVHDAALRRGASVPIVLTSQVEPGFTRSLGIKNIYHMAETLRIKDALERAIAPEQFIVGMADTSQPIHSALAVYIASFDAAVTIMTFEEAEFAKIAINMFLAAQVNTTNTLCEAALKVGARWQKIAAVLKLDRRIGPHAYLEPGRWQDSTHLLRDHYTLEAILAR